MRRPIDTSVAARARQLDAYRAMTPEARLRLAAEMSATGSLASSYHGEPRSTRDIDIVIDPSPLGLAASWQHIRDDVGR